MLDQNGYISYEWQQWLQNPEFNTVVIDTPLPVESGGTGQITSVQDVLQMAGPIYASTPTGPTAGDAQVDSALWGGNGAPDNAGGQNGDFYFRGDGTVGSNVYKKAAGLWTAIL